MKKVLTTVLAIIMMAAMTTAVAVAEVTICVGDEYPTQLLFMYETEDYAIACLCDIRNGNYFYMDGHIEVEKVIDMTMLCKANGYVIDGTYYDEESFFEDYAFMREVWQFDRMFNTVYGNCSAVGLN